MNNKLNELFHLTGKNDFEFTYKTDGEDNIIGLDIDNKTINVNIANPEDEALDGMIQDVIVQLKKTFN
jgi:hypothetical protein